MRKIYRELLLSLLLLSLLSSTLSACALFTKNIVHKGSLSSANSIAIHIDYTGTVTAMNPLAFSIDETEYANGHYLINDPLEQQRIESLAPDSIRLSLKYSVPGDPASRIVCEAEGCDSSYTGDQWVNAVKAAGAKPVLIVSENVTDAVNLLKHFNKQTHNYIGRWIIGNEPDLHNISAVSYSLDFKKIYDAMKAVDPTVKIGGPAISSYNAAFLSTFLTVSGDRVDFIDFHQYGEDGNNHPQSQVSLLNATAQYTVSINLLKQQIATLVPSRVANIEIAIDEWSLTYSGGDSASVHSIFNTLWGASVIGHIIQTGALASMYGTKENALAGGTDNVYGTKLDETMPEYYALGMFTGEGLFQGFGTSMVSASLSASDIEVYASKDPQDIVIINKSPVGVQTSVITLKGSTAIRAEIWRKDASMSPYAAPQDRGAITIINNQFIYNIPPYSITTLVLSSALSSLI